MSAALTAVETIEPASPRRRLAGGGNSTWMKRKRWVVISRTGREHTKKGERKEKCKESGV